MLHRCNNAKFILSAGNSAQLPNLDGEEFALVGRSNVGKSSFINHACANGTLARTSKRPGTTVCANFYQIDKTLYWVDLPGYGYAEARGNEKERWAALAQGYCRNRQNLRGIIWIVDIRHIGVAADCEAYGWLQHLGKPVLPLLAKADKLSASGRKLHAKEFLARFEGFGEPEVYSVHENAARERFWKRFEVWRNSIARPV
jgi:GTP-binding protein